MNPLANLDPKKFTNDNLRESILKDAPRTLADLIARATTPEKKKQFAPIIETFELLMGPDNEHKENCLKKMIATRISANEAMLSMKDGFPCECGGMMYYIFERGCHYNPDKNIMYDSYDLQCERCNKKDVFVKDLPHMQEHADMMKEQGITEDIAVSSAKYTKAVEKGRHA